MRAARVGEVRPLVQAPVGQAGERLSTGGTDPDIGSGHGMRPPRGTPKPAEPGAGGATRGVPRCSGGVEASWLRRRQSSLGPAAPAAPNAPAQPGRPGPARRPAGPCPAERRTAWRPRSRSRMASTAPRGMVTVVSGCPDPARWRTACGCHILRLLLDIGGRPPSASSRPIRAVVIHGNRMRVGRLASRGATVRRHIRPPSPRHGRCGRRRRFGAAGAEHPPRIRPRHSPSEMGCAPDENSG